MHPGGQLLQRPALHRVLDHLKPGAFLEGDLPQRVLLGRVDRDVPKERRLLWQVGISQGHRDGRGVHRGPAVALRTAGRCAERAMNAR